MKLRNIVAIILAFITVGALAQQPILIDKVVARVGSENILLSEIEEEYSYVKKSDPTVDTKVKCEILDNIISQKVIIYQAKLDSVEVTDEQVNIEQFSACGKIGVKHHREKWLAYTQQ